jgi:hypothetical protein
MAIAMALLLLFIITSECHLFSIVYLVSPCSFYFELKNSTSDARN